MGQILLLCALAQAGPIIYYKGDDTPPTAVDSVAARNGAYTGGATTSAVTPTLQFANPTSMIFDGVDDLVTEATLPWPAPGGPVTVAFWNFVPTGSVQNSSAFSVGNQDGVNRFHAHAPWGDNTLYWDYGDIGGTGRISTPYASFVNAWTHVALVSAGTAGNFKAIYLNGNVANSATSSDGPDIAMSGVVVGGFAALRHKGQIDDFRVYARVLTAPQIQLLAQGHTEPAAPVVNVVLTPGQADLSWAAVPATLSYTIERSLNGGAFAQIASVTGTSYSDGGLNPGDTYTYRVAAVGISQGPWSSNVGGPIPLPPPRVNDHEEGLLGDGCACGSTARGAWTLGALLLGLLAFAGRRGKN